MDFPKHFLTNQLFIRSFIKKQSSSSNISYFNMLKKLFFFCQFGWKFAREYLQICSDWFKWHQASEPIVGLANFLQFIHSLPSALNLVSWYPLWYWQPPVLLDSAERSFAICNPSYSDVCQFKDSVHVFLELLEGALWVMGPCHIRNLSSWMDSDFQNLFSSQEVSLEKKCWVHGTADLKKNIGRCSKLSCLFVLLIVDKVKLDISWMKEKYIQNMTWVLPLIFGKQTKRWHF